MTLENIMKVATTWATSPVFDRETHREVSELIEAKDYSELTNRFYQDLEFGTGGLRGIYGAGSAYVNPYTIRRASHALSLYLKKVYPSELLRIAISFDSRTHSEGLAKIAASVFAGHGIRSFLALRMKPVPMLSYAVRHYNCHAGICLTASHNPPAYHGYKVYWKTGGQVVPPHDKEIIKVYEANDDYAKIPSKPFEQLRQNEDVVFFDQDLDDAYFKDILGLRAPVKDPTNVSIVFTPLHGSGLHPIRDILTKAGYENLFIVPEQEQPDGRFPTVAFPNPEDPDALKLAIAHAENRQANLVLATDPDADRIGIVFRDRQGRLQTLNGNQIGCLLTYYVILRLKEGSGIPKDAVMIKTIVTTDLQRKIAESFGCESIDTLTGFKWICGLVEEFESGIRKPYKQFICGGEESYGFLAGRFVRDKDGVQACLLACDMVSYFKSQNLDMHDVLDQLYQKFGAYLEDLFTITLPGKEGADKIREMMEMLRAKDQKKIGEFEVIATRDYLRGSELPPSNVIQYDLRNHLGWEARVSMRPSGTEPKIKLYLSVSKPYGSRLKDREDLTLSIKLIKEYFLGLFGES